MTRHEGHTLSRTEIDRLAIAIPADRRSILKELRRPGSVRGRAGERIRAALADLWSQHRKPGSPNTGLAGVEITAR